jgi:hypothetical protein
VISLLVSIRVPSRSKIRSLTGMKNYITDILLQRIYQRDLQTFNLDGMFKIKERSLS